MNVVTDEEVGDRLETAVLGTERLDAGPEVAGAGQTGDVGAAEAQVFELLEDGQLVGKAVQNQVAVEVEVAIAHHFQ